MRFKREKTLADQCKELAYASVGTGLVADLASDVGSIPIIGDAAGVFTAGIAMAGHTSKAGVDLAYIALDCSSVPFDELKQIMDQRFNEINRKLDKNTEALEEVTKLASKTLVIVEKIRRELREGFDLVLETIANKEIKSIVNKINSFVQYFENEKGRLSSLPQDEYVFKLQEPNNILQYLKESRTPKGDSLHSALFEIMDKNNNYAIPKSARDAKAFQALYALFYGAQAYISVMFFLIEQYSYLAEYHYQQGNTKEFNRQFDMIKTTFKDFKFSLIGESNSNPIINDVISLLDQVKRKDFISKVNNHLYREISNRTTALERLKSEIIAMELPLIYDTPKPVAQITFTPPVLETPYGDWKDHSVVRYAIQLKSEGIYSKLSDWSKPFTVQGKANPTLKVPVDQKLRDRLVFRKFNDDKPQLVGVLRESQTDFKDIDRDLYNAAGRVDKDLALKEVGMLLQNGADLDSVFDLERNALHSAAHSGNNRVALKYLLKSLDKNKKDRKGNAPIHVAAEAGQSGFVQLLADLGADVNTHTYLDYVTPLHIAAKLGFKKTVQILLDSDAIRPNEKAKDGFTPLHYATLGGPKIVEALISNAKTDVNFKSNVGLAPLHLAVINDNQKAAEVLIKRGKANLNAEDDSQMTPFHFATMLGNLEMTKYLMSLQGTNVNAVATENKWTPLHFAIFFKKEDTALLLLSNVDIDLRAVAKGKITPLHLAVATGQMNIVAELVNRHADLESKTVEGFTPLHLAAMRIESETSALLIEKGSEIESRTKDGSTPLHLAAKTGRIGTLLNLLDRGADINAKNYDEATALHVTCFSNMEESVEILLSRSADAKVKDNKNHFPIHYAILNFNVGIVKKILDHDSIFQNFESEEGVESVYSIFEAFVNDLYHYLLNKDTEEFEKFKDMEPFEVYEAMGKIDLLRVFDPTQQEDVKDIFNTYLNMVEYCIEEGESVKLCEVVKPTRSSRNAQLQRITKDGAYVSKIDSAATNDVNIPYNRLVNAFNKFSIKPLKFVDNFSSPKRSENNSVQDVNVNGSLLLLDLLVRRLTNEKYKSAESGPVSDLEAQATALEITEKFEQFIESMTGSSTGEEIDLAKIHSDIYKAIASGTESKITKMLCSHVETFSKSEPNQLEETTAAYNLTDNRIARRLRNSVLRKASYLLEKLCIA